MNTGEQAPPIEDMNKINGDLEAVTHGGSMGNPSMANSSFADMDSNQLKEALEESKDISSNNGIKNIDLNPNNGDLDSNTLKEAIEGKDAPPLNDVIKDDQINANNGDIDNNLLKDDIEGNKVASLNNDIKDIDSNTLKEAIAENKDVSLHNAIKDINLNANGDLDSNQSKEPIEENKAAPLNEMNPSNGNTDSNLLKDDIDENKDSLDNVFKDDEINANNGDMDNNLSKNGFEENKDTSINNAIKDIDSNTLKDAIEGNKDTSLDDVIKGIDSSTLKNAMEEHSTLLKNAIKEDPINPSKEISGDEKANFDDFSPKSNEFVEPLQTTGDASLTQHDKMMKDHILQTTALQNMLLTNDTGNIDSNNNYDMGIGEDMQQKHQKDEMNPNIFTNIKHKFDQLADNQEFRNEGGTNVVSIPITQNNIMTGHTPISRTAGIVMQGPTTHDTNGDRFGDTLDDVNSWAGLDMSEDSLLRGGMYSQQHGYMNSLRGYDTGGVSGPTQEGFHYFDPDFVHLCRNMIGIKNCTNPQVLKNGIKNTLRKLVHRNLSYFHHLPPMNLTQGDALNKTFKMSLLDLRNYTDMNNDTLKRDGNNSSAPSLILSKSFDDEINFLANIIMKDMSRKEEIENMNNTNVAVNKTSGDKNSTADVDSKNSTSEQNISTSNLPKQLIDSDNNSRPSVNLTSDNINENMTTEGLSKQLVDSGPAVTNCSQGNSTSLGKVKGCEPLRKNIVIADDDGSVAALADALGVTDSKNKSQTVGNCSQTNSTSTGKLMECKPLLQKNIVIADDDGSVSSMGITDETITNFITDFVSSETSSSSPNDTSGNDKAKVRKGGLMGNTSNHNNSHNSTRSTKHLLNENGLLVNVKVSDADDNDSAADESQSFSERVFLVKPGNSNIKDTENLVSVTISNGTSSDLKYDGLFSQKVKARDKFVNNSTTNLNNSLHTANKNKSVASKSINTSSSHNGNLTVENKVSPPIFFIGSNKSKSNADNGTLNKPIKKKPMILSRFINLVKTRGPRIDTVGKTSKRHSTVDQNVRFNRMDNLLKQNLMQRISLANVMTKNNISTTQRTAIENEMVGSHIIPDLSTLKDNDINVNGRAFIGGDDDDERYSKFQENIDRLLDQVRSSAFSRKHTIQAFKKAHALHELLANTRQDDKRMRKFLANNFNEGTRFANELVGNKRTHKKYDYLNIENTLEGKSNWELPKEEYLKSPQGVRILKKNKKHSSKIDESSNTINVTQSNVSNRAVQSVPTNEQELTKPNNNLIQNSTRPLNSTETLYDKYSKFSEKEEKRGENTTDINKSMNLTQPKNASSGSAEAISPNEQELATPNGFVGPLSSNAQEQANSNSSVDATSSNTQEQANSTSSADLISSDAQEIANSIIDDQNLTNMINDKANITDIPMKGIDNSLTQAPKTFSPTKALCDRKCKIRKEKEEEERKANLKLDSTLDGRRPFEVQMENEGKDSQGLRITKNTSTTVNAEKSDVINRSAEALKTEGQELTNKYAMNDKPKIVDISINGVDNKTQKPDTKLRSSKTLVDILELNEALSNIIRAVKDGGQKFPPEKMLLVKNILKHMNHFYAQVEKENLSDNEVPESHLNNSKNPAGDSVHIRGIMKSSILHKSALKENNVTASKEGGMKFNQMDKMIKDHLLQRAALANELRRGELIPDLTTLNDYDLSFSGKTVRKHQYEEPGKIQQNIDDLLNHAMLPMAQRKGTIQRNPLTNLFKDKENATKRTLDEIVQYNNQFLKDVGIPKVIWRKNEIGGQEKKSKNIFKMPSIRSIQKKTENDRGNKKVIMGKANSTKRQIAREKVSSHILQLLRATKQRLKNLPRTVIANRTSPRNATKRDEFANEMMSEMNDLYSEMKNLIHFNDYGKKLSKDIEQVVNDARKSQKNASLITSHVPISNDTSRINDMDMSKYGNDGGPDPVVIERTVATKSIISSKSSEPARSSFFDSNYRYAKRKAHVETEEKKRKDNINYRHATTQQRVHWVEPDTLGIARYRILH